MSKNFTLLLIAFLSSNVALNAQDNSKLLQELKNDRLKNELKFNQLPLRKTSVIDSLRNYSTLAGFIGDLPYFYTQDDLRANIGSGVNSLSTTGINNFILDGKNIDILIIDGGKVQADHIEFRDLNQLGSSRITDLENGAQETYSTHSTSVAGFISAEGRTDITLNGYINGISRGVLPKSKIKHYGFTTTTNGTNYEKLVLGNMNISNHSYGTNLGWDPYNEKGAMGPGWYFNIANYQNNIGDANATLSGSYYTNDQKFDKIVYENQNYIVVKSAGNSYGDGPHASDTTSAKYYYNGSTWTAMTSTDLIPAKNCLSNAYCIGWGSLAKNVIVVGASNLASTTDYKYTTPESVITASFSSAGPRKDGGIKPDISTYGVSLVSPTYSATSTNAYSLGSGTSYSAPIVTGAVGMLTELQRISKSNSNFTFFADEAKAILLHTADEAGLNEGPDIYFGWGLLNVETAAKTLLDSNTIFERKSKVSGTNIVYEVVSDGTPLKASISWIDPEATPYTTVNDLFYNTTSRLVNDLDVYVIEEGLTTKNLPWKLDLNNVTGPAIKGDNTVDNYEQVLIKAPTKGTKYKVVISNKGTLIDNVGSPKDQNVAVLITGVTSGALGLNNIEVKNSISVYPTVTRDIVNVKTADKLKSVEIFNLSGQKVLSTNKNTIDVSSLSAGVYIVTVETDKGKVSNKIVKQ